MYDQEHKSPKIDDFYKIDGDKLVITYIKLFYVYILPLITYLIYQIHHVYNIYPVYIYFRVLVNFLMTSIKALMVFDEMSKWKIPKK